MTDLGQLARGIIKNNIYLTLGTTDGETPWVAPLFYCVDEDYNFYFISQLESLHSKYVAINPKVAFAIFDSHAKEGKGTGVQGSGEVHIVKDEDLPKEINNYHTTFIEVKPEMLTGNAPYRLFKLIPNKLFVLDPEAKVDKRVEVTTPIGKCNNR